VIAKPGQSGWILVVLASVMLVAGCAGSPETPTGPMGSPVGTARAPDDESVAPSGNEKLKQFDLNHDNKPDVWAYYTQMTDPKDPQGTRESLVRKEWDFNFDGKVDIRRHFNFKGEAVKDELDLDFDGRFDVTTFYRSGSKIRQEFDFNFDSKPDYWKFFEKNVITRTERDRDFNGRVDRWEYYTEGNIERIGLDEDGDGQIDKWIQEEHSE
jgi:hypothetical protein